MAGRDRQAPPRFKSVDAPRNVQKLKGNAEAQAAAEKKIERLKAQRLAREAGVGTERKPDE